jgi:hypothetical protein
MASFDPIRAQRELLVGLEEALRAIHAMRRKAEREMGKAEAAFNALVKIEALTRERLDEEHSKLARLEADAVE